MKTKKKTKPFNAKKFEITFPLFLKQYKTPVLEGTKQKNAWKANNLFKQQQPCSQHMQHQPFVGLEVINHLESSSLICICVGWDACMTLRSLCMVDRPGTQTDITISMTSIFYGQTMTWENAWRGWMDGRTDRQTNKKTNLCWDNLQTAFPMHFQMWTGTEDNKQMAPLPTYRQADRQTTVEQLFQIPTTIRWGNDIHTTTITLWLTITIY